MQGVSVASVEIERLKNGVQQKDTDLLAVEEPMEIRLDFGNKSERRSQPISAVSYTHLTLPTTPYV